MHSHKVVSAYDLSPFIIIITIIIIRQIVHSSVNMPFCIDFENKITHATHRGYLIFLGVRPNLITPNEHQSSIFTSGGSHTEKYKYKFWCS